jgi:hypothetical protein
VQQDFEDQEHFVRTLEGSNFWRGLIQDFSDAAASEALEAIVRDDLATMDSPRHAAMQHGYDREFFTAGLIGLHSREFVLIDNESNKIKGWVVNLSIVPSDST